MKELFDIAAGAVRGREHDRLGVNSHDALQVLVQDQGIVAVVCDGCGSGAHSEIGAKLGAAIIPRVVGAALAADGMQEPAALLERVRGEALEELRRAALILGGVRPEVVGAYLLFTVVGAIITPARSIVFALGDGVFAVNGRVHLLERDNQPPYLAYALLPECAVFPESELRFQVLDDRPTAAIESLLVGTDGFGRLYAETADETQSELARLWEHDCYFGNPYRVGRELRLLARERRTIDWERRAVAAGAGPLLDDAAVVALRRRRPAAPSMIH